MFWQARCSMCLPPHEHVGCRSAAIQRDDEIVLIVGRDRMRKYAGVPDAPRIAREPSVHRCNMQ
jgi:hypothetical protein